MLLETPGALLSRSHLRELGLERGAVDAVFRALDVVVLPGNEVHETDSGNDLQVFEPKEFKGGRVRVYGCSPGCLLVDRAVRLPDARR
jgi:hypothetical protein